LAGPQHPARGTTLRARNVLSISVDRSDACSHRHSLCGNDDYFPAGFQDQLAEIIEQIVHEGSGAFRKFDTAARGVEATTNTAIRIDQQRPDAPRHGCLRNAREIFLCGASRLSRRELRDEALQALKVIRRDELPRALA
jgi:hypothetical protein